MLVTVSLANPAGAQMKALTPADIDAANAVGASSGEGARVLFLGNSFTYEHEIPALVAQQAQAAGVTLRPALLAEGGGRLARTLEIAGVRAVVAEHDWDAVVAQDHSTTGLDPDRAMTSAKAMAEIAALAAPAPLLIITPWARAAEHPIYTRGTGLRASLTRPEDPKAMTVATASHAATVAAGLKAHHRVA
ncbi:MAG: hypothetical protein AAFT19_02685, partial [Pseudomonadota bacterium]